jgi:hypothetical protein
MTSRDAARNGFTGSAHFLIVRCRPGRALARCYSTSN